MTLFVVDASHYQAGLPVPALKAQGFDALILKATQGSGWVDSSFSPMLAAGRSAGLFLAAYHFLEPGGDAYARAQAAHCAAVVPPDIPVWVDVEKQGATRAEAYVFAAALRAHESRLGGIYCGSQPAAGWGGWWRAAYLSDPTAFASVAYQQLGGDTGPGWSAGSGRHPDLWQFCDHGRVTGYSGDVDFSAFRGTVEQLRATGWFWSPPVPTPVPTPVPSPAPVPVPVPEEDDVAKVVVPMWLVGGTLVLMQSPAPGEDGRPRLLRLFGGPANGSGRQYHDWADNGGVQVVLLPADLDFLHALGLAVEGVDFNQERTGWPEHGHELAAAEFEGRR